MNADKERPGASASDTVRAVEDAAATEPTERVMEPAAEPETAEATAGEAAPAAGTTPPGEEVDYRDRWLRTEADLQNFRRRAQRDVEESARAAEERVLRDLIEILDDVERGIETARNAGADAAWVQGMELVGNRARDALARYGVTPMDPIGQPFDPRVHEAMFEMDSAEHTPGTVVQVVRRGFLRGDRPLRAARVGVARARVE